MTAKYFAILTNQGAARLANAAALGTKLNLTQMAVGDANGVLPTPDPAQTKLINQKRIAPLNLLTVDPANTSQIIAEQIIPENEGGFWIREIGLYDDAGVLIAVANCPETYKPELQEGSGRTQTIRMILIVSSTSAITLKIDPSVVLATRQYVDDKVIEVKSYADGLIRAHEQSRNHPDATTTAKGFTQLNSSVTDDRETQSATPKAVKIAMDNANARLAKERNLSDLTNPALARQNLQLGDSSTKNTGTTANTVAAGDDARITGAMQKSQNGGDIPDVAKFLQNLGLGDDARLSGNLTVKGGVWDTAPGDTPERVWSPNNKPSLATLGVVDATTTQKGIIELATNAEMATGTSSSLVPSVAAVMSIFSKRSFSANDYVRIPDVPGGLIIQWVSGNASANGVFFAQMPIPFPNKLLFAGAVEAGANVWGADSATTWGIDFANSSLSQVIAYARRIFPTTVTQEAAAGLVIAIGN